MATKKKLTLDELALKHQNGFHEAVGWTPETLKDVQPSDMKALRTAMKNCAKEWHKQQTAR